MASGIDRFMNEANSLNDALKQKRAWISQLAMTIDSKQIELDALRTEKEKAEQEASTAELKLQGLFKGFGGMADMHHGRESVAPRPARPSLEQPQVSRMREGKSTPPSTKQSSLSNAMRSINDTYPTVIEIEGVWTEVRCKHCHANAVSQYNTFFKGVPGMKGHMFRSHSLHVGDAILEHLNQRPVSDRDVKLMAKASPQHPLDSPIQLCFGEKHCKICDVHKCGGSNTPRNVSDAKDGQNVRTMIDADSIFSLHRAPRSHENGEQPFRKDLRRYSINAASLKSTRESSTSNDISTAIEKLPAGRLSEPLNTFQHVSEPNHAASRGTPALRTGFIDLSRDPHEKDSNEDQTSQYDGGSDNDGTGREERNTLWPSRKRRKAEESDDE